MNKQSMQDMVEEFMVEGKQDLDADFEPNLFNFRMTLIAEEFKELAEAAADLTINAGDNPEELEVRKEHVLKELCDCMYVLTGLASTFGWPVATAFDRVHESNMTKLPFQKTDDGKIMKGPNYEPCDLGGLV